MAVIAWSVCYLANFIDDFPNADMLSERWNTRQIKLPRFSRVLNLDKHANWVHVRIYIAFLFFGLCVSDTLSSVRIARSNFVMSGF